MIKKFINFLNQGGEYAALSTDLLKTFGCLVQHLVTISAASKHGVVNDSILGPIFFNMFLCNIFLLIDSAYIVNYTDDNTQLKF